MTTGALHVDLPGEVIRPGDATYDQVRAVFNGMIDRRPLAVLRCREPADVARGVAFSREHDVPLAIRGGGHNVAGHAVCDDGIMLDLSQMTTCGSIRIFRPASCTTGRPAESLTP